MEMKMEEDRMDFSGVSEGEQLSQYQALNSFWGEDVIEEEMIGDITLNLETKSNWNSSLSLSEQSMNVAVKHLDLYQDISFLPSHLIQSIHDLILSMDHIQSSPFIHFNPSPLLLNQHSISLLINSKKLVSLNLEGMNSIPDNILKNIESCVDLKELNLINCRHLSQNSLKGIIQNCNQLRKFSLSECHQVNNSCLKLIAESGMQDKLEEFAIAGCFEVSTDGILDLTKACKSLKRLNLSFLQHIDDKAIEEVAQNFTELIDIDLSYCNIKNEGFSKLATNRTNLEKIRLESCVQLQDTDVIAFGECKQLKDIHLAYCTSITDASIQAIAVNCALLTSIDLTCNENITDTSVMYIVNFSKNIQTLVLKRCLRITDEAILQLKQFCTGTLQILNVEGCIELTDRSISQLRDMKTLTDVDLSFLTNVTWRGIEPLIQNCPLSHLRIWGHAIPQSVVKEWSNQRNLMKIWSSIQLLI